MSHQARRRGGLASLLAMSRGVLTKFVPEKVCPSSHDRGCSSSLALEGMKTGVCMQASMQRLRGDMTGSKHVHKHVHNQPTT